MSSRNHVPKPAPRPFETVYVTLQGVFSEGEIAYGLDLVNADKRTRSLSEIVLAVTAQIDEQNKQRAAEIVAAAQETARNLPAQDAATWREQTAIVRADTERRELSREKRLQREAQDALNAMRARLKQAAIPTRQHVCRLMQRVGVIAAR